MIAFQSFHVTCKGLIFHKDQFLLHLANDPDFYGALECPGGRVNQDELIENALKRELIEEIGLDLDTIEHTLELFGLNQRDAAEYDWDKNTQIIEVYYKITIPDQVTFELKPLEEVSRFEWIHKETDLNAYHYKVASRKAIYEKAQHSLKNPKSLR
jgi:8-oxo-dGTP pyrophosphatase MutT (NUDIX family)